MLRLCSMLFALLLIAVGWFIVTTTGQLPDPVATHFGTDNLANGFMTREGYLAFSLAFATLVPIVVAALVGWLPRRYPQSLSILNNAHWLAPERRDATFESVSVRGIVLGGLLAIFTAGVHWLILQANAAVPPKLPIRLFWTMLGAFVVVFVVWIGSLRSRFHGVSR
jgi:hypothetical protein